MATHLPNIIDGHDESQGRCGPAFHQSRAERHQQTVADQSRRRQDN